MNYRVYLTRTFKSSLKRLKKKYPKVKNDVEHVNIQLEENPEIGDPIPGWNKEVWKIRAKSSDLKKGKRGGFRLIY
ncbi:MAG: hypothetical protein ACE5KE_09190 [Methanosarcinales archaeon]